MNANEAASGAVGQSNSVELKLGAGLVFALAAAKQTLEPVTTPFK